MTGGYEVGQPLEKNFNKESIENEAIREFSPNNFNVPVVGEKFNSEKDISVDDSDYNSERLE